MTLQLHIPEQDGFKPRIAVFGVGGAGGNAVNNMIDSHLQGVSFVVANTDAQALESSRATQQVQLGGNLTSGLGAGAAPEVGGAAAEESLAEILEYLEDCNMAFITAGMGGGTGTGAAPVIARAAREKGILTVGVVTKPFHFEGVHRMRIAEAGIEELQQYVDTLIVIPNQNLFRIADEKTTFADAFTLADNVLHAGVRGVTDLIVMPGLINLDFADIKTVMSEMGKAMMGTGESEGEARSVRAAEAAISNPLLDNVTMKGAKGVLINITGGMDMTLFEVDEAANRIREEVESDANIIFGSTFSPELDGMIRVSVIATGIDSETINQPVQEDKKEKKRKSRLDAYTESVSIAIREKFQEEQEAKAKKAEQELQKNEEAEGSNSPATANLEAESESKEQEATEDKAVEAETAQAEESVEDAYEYEFDTAETDEVDGEVYATEEDADAISDTQAEAEAEAEEIAAAEDDVTDESDDADEDRDIRVEPIISSASKETADEGVEEKQKIPSLQERKAASAQARADAIANSGVAPKSLENDFFGSLTYNPAIDEDETLEFVHERDDSAEYAKEKQRSGFAFFGMMSGAKKNKEGGLGGGGIFKVPPTISNAPEGLNTSVMEDKTNSASQDDTINFDAVGEYNDTAVAGDASPAASAAAAFQDDQADVAVLDREEGAGNKESSERGKKEEIFEIPAFLRRREDGNED